MATITRKIFFYRNASVRLEEGANVPIDAEPLLRRIPGIQYPDRYMRAANGRIMMDLLPTQGGAVAGWIGLSRTTALPEAELMGRLTDLHLQTGEGVNDRTHWVYFPDTGILGMEFNWYAPRTTRLSEYLTEKTCGPTESADFVPILNSDALDRAGRLRLIKKLTIRASADGVEMIRREQASLANALAGVGSLSDAHDVELVLTASSGGHFKLPKFFAPLVRALRRHDDATVAALDRVIVVGREPGDEKDTPIDLLGDVFVYSATVARVGTTRVVESEPMIRQIRGVYEQFRSYLRRD